MTESELTAAALRVAAKYKNKKVVKTQNGDKMTVYEYSDRQNALRDGQKAKRVEGLRKNLPKLRKKYQKDLNSEDVNIRLTALAVALIDETYERVGNSESAKNGHYGVTGWKKEHLSFSDSKAILKYVGKSGVDHVKEVTDSKVVKALRDLAKGKKKGDALLCDGEDCVITASKVNEYLRELEITAKDLRGVHANEIMKVQLKEIRGKGPTLPKDKKEKDKILKEEFKKALEASAEAVGHAPTMLRSSYLVPGLEEAFMKDGTVMKALDKKGALESATPEDLQEFFWEFFSKYHALQPYSRIKVSLIEKPGGGSHPEASFRHGKIEIYPKFWGLPALVRDFVFAHEIGHWVHSAFGSSSFISLAELHGVDPWASSHLPFAQFNQDEAFADCFASYFIDGDVKRRYPQWSSLVEEVVKKVRTATKSKSEKEDEQAERLVRQSPTKKPPRRDLERGIVDEADDDPDKKRDKKDRSQNYKDSSARVALRYFLSEVPPSAKGKSGDPMFKQFLNDSGDKTVKNPQTNHDISIFTLSRYDEPWAKEIVKKEYENWKGAEKAPQSEPDSPKKDKDDSKSKDDKEPESNKEEEPESKKKPEDGLAGLPENLKDLKDPKKFEEFRGKVLEKYSELGLSEDQVDEILDGVEDVENPTEFEVVKSLLDGAAEENKKNLSQKKRKTQIKQDEALDDPTQDLDDPIPESGILSDDEDLADEREASVHRAMKAITKYSDMHANEREEHMDKLEKEISGLDSKDARRVHLEAVRRGLGIASALKDGDKARGVGSSISKLVKAAQANGELENLVSVLSLGGEESAGSDDQAHIRRVYNGLKDSDWSGVLPDSHPGKALADLLADPEKGQHLNDDDKARIKEHLADMMLAETAFLDPAVTKKVGRGATVGTHKAGAKASRVTPRTPMPELSDEKGLAGWVADIVQSTIKAAIGDTEKTEKSDKPKEKSPEETPGGDEEKEHQSGDVWEQGGEFWAKDPTGNVSSFKSKEYAENFASGGSGERLKTGVWWSFLPQTLS